MESAGVERVSFGPTEQHVILRYDDTIYDSTWTYDDRIDGTC